MKDWHDKYVPKDKTIYTLGTTAAKLIVVVWASMFCYGAYEFVTWLT